MSGGRPSDDDAGVAERAAAVLDRFESLSLTQMVAAIAVLAVLVRLVLLDARSAHWDEARVAYWILHTVETGDFAYRRIIHGPFLQHVGHLLFPILGPTDFAMRLPVAILGGLFPLTALLFREHLEDEEVVALALFLAFNAVLVYYSRFMRSDVPVALFMFAGFGLLVRFYDTRRWRYLYGMAALVALGFAAKENAAVYVITWIGGTAVLAEYGLYRPRGDRSGLDVLRSTWLGTLGARLRRLPGQAASVLRGQARVTTAAVRRRFAAIREDAVDPETTAGSVVRWLVHPVGAGLVFLVVMVLLYAPRGDGAAGLHFQTGEPANRTIGLFQDLPRVEGERGLYGALLQPGSLPDLAVRTLQDTATQFWEWFAQSGEPGCRKDTVVEGWLCFLGQYVEVMWEHARVLSILAVVGFAYERYVRVRSRNLVMFSFYVGFVSVLGYPLGTDVFGAWIVVHAVVPLAIPAAVALALLYRWGREARADGDDVAAALAAVVLLLLAAQVGAMNATGVYTNDAARANTLVQYAQPADDLDPVVAAMERAVAEGRDDPEVVLYYGANGTERDDGAAIVATRFRRIDGELLTRPACAEWFNALPLPWYIAATDANATCIDRPAALVGQARTTGPAVIVAVQSDPTLPTDRLLAAGYERRTVGLRTYGRLADVFVHERVGGI